jgi:carbamoyl-phosphate synthase large subunit
MEMQQWKGLWEIKMNNVLFCSAGRRVKLLEDFKNTIGNTGKLIVADNSNLAPTIYVADKSYLVPKIYDENYIETILNICKKEDIKIVCTLIDPEIKILADNKEKFEELGILVMTPSSQTAELCFDKFKMYKYLKENNINTVTTYGSIEEFENNKDGVVFPVFVKPRTGSGSVGARKVENIETLKKLFEEDDTLIIQELMTGKDLDADIYVDTITNEVISIFSKNKLETKIGGANKTVSFKDEELNEFIKNVVSKFEFKGTINMDFFKKDGRYYLSEVNPRFGGGYIHPYAAGVDFIKYLINNSKGEKNTPEIGNYEEGSIMMMYDDIVFVKPEELK